ncbi:MAG: hypothetical protein IJ044_02915, partial [Oscillospiraceae bacterium]|nr:hypothetical protein [Oscillospiraceae bacterium]
NVDFSYSKDPNKLALAGVDLGRSLERRGLLILPCLNPDGTAIALRGPSAAGFCAPLVQKCWY